ncbi:MAG TPA: polysaccharide deacetylase family protein [Burkholderiales bacterium]|nr:polysaccharide deacetylase family protein [Burkholderiales bacterium]
MRAKQRGETILNTSTAINSENGRRWRPAPAIHVSVFLHAAAAVWLAAHPPAWPWALGVLGANHVALFLAVLWPRGQLLGPNLVRLPAPAVRRREIALTFDDGPDPEVTPRVLELLDRFRAKASFFCIGEKAAAYPELVKEIARRGHSVENHSYHHHQAFAFFGISRLRREVDAAQATVAAITGRPPVFFRAPAGFRSPLLDPVLAPRGLRYVSWTRRGFDAVSGDPNRILRQLTRGLSAGDVLLLHDRAPVVLAVLPALLGQISAQGLKAVSLASGCADELVE